MDHDEMAYNLPLVLPEHQYEFIAVPGHIEMTLPPGYQMILHNSINKAPEPLFAESALAFSLGSSASLMEAAAPGGKLETLARSLVKVEVDVGKVEKALQQRAQQLFRECTGTQMPHGINKESISQ